MTILGIFFIVVSIFLIYRRLTFVLFGKTAKGIIIGYGNSFKSYKGIESHPYKVKYQYGSKEYIG